ncbi:MAG TPA: AAA family ATPase [Vicinamibacterales bacterium]|nr:AAA family ATPase [Vicinamibacterales bacterium]
MTGETRSLPAPERIAAGQEKIARLVSELRRVLLGKEQTIDEVVAALLARGHVLLEGLPGLGKTELIKALSRLLSLEFRRIQFTPDLLPTDITGSHILQERDGRKEFVFHPGPVFTNLLLADEINRASPKTQAALLEAMQERRVTTFGETRPLPDPFFVLATQNPIELEGTYPLPEAQLDRFMFKVDIAGVERSVLEQILTSRVRGEPPPLEPVLSSAELEELFALTDAVHLPNGVAGYIARLVAASHPSSADAPEPVRTFVRYGSSPRAAIAMGTASRALALLRGKPNVGFDDVKRVALPAMAHRLVLDYTAKLEGWDGRRVVGALIEAVPEIERGLPQTLDAR